MTNFIIHNETSILTKFFLLIEDFFFNYLPENNFDNILM